MSTIEATVALSDAEAEDNQKLGTIFNEKVSLRLCCDSIFISANAVQTQQDGKAGNWTGPHTVTIRGPLQRTTAIVMQRAENGWVRVFKVLTERDHRPVAQYNASTGSLMIIINQNEYAWVMGNAIVKYIE